MYKYDQTWRIVPGNTISQGITGAPMNRPDQSPSFTYIRQLGIYSSYHLDSPVTWSDSYSRKTWSTHHKSIISPPLGNLIQSHKMISLLLVSLVVATVSGTKSGCDIASSTPFKTRLSCGGIPISITHRDTPTSSFFSLSTPSTPDLITVTYSNQVTNSNKEIEILVNGERRELSDPLEDLLTSHPWLGAAARTVHDKLKLPAWKRPSVMFLYRLGMAAIEHPEFQESEFQEVEVDKENIKQVNQLVEGDECPPYFYQIFSLQSLQRVRTRFLVVPPRKHSPISTYTRSDLHSAAGDEVGSNHSRGGGGAPPHKGQKVSLEYYIYLSSMAQLPDDEEEPSWAGEWVKRNHKLVTFLGGEGDGGGRVGETKPQVRAFPDETKAPIAPCNCRVQSTFRLVWKEVCTLGDMSFNTHVILSRVKHVQLHPANFFPDESLQAAIAGCNCTLEPSSGKKVVGCNCRVQLQGAARLERP
eukprot:sb/3464380/